MTTRIAHEPEAAMSDDRRMLSRIPSMVVLLTAVGLVLRIMVASRGGLWRDEALFLFVTRLPTWTAMLDFLRLHESQPPLFYVVMRPWLAMTGDTDAAAVVLPIVFGVVLIPVIYFVGTSLFSKRVGLLAAALAAFSPSLTEHSALVRPYSLLPLLALISCYTLIWGIEKGGRRRWIAYSVSTLAMLYTHNWAWLVLGGEWIAAGLVILGGADRGRSAVVREFLLAQLLIAVGFLAWASWLVYQTQHAGHPPSLLSLRDEPVRTFAIAARALFQATLLAYPPIDGPTTLDAVKRWFLALPVILLIGDQFLRARKAQRLGDSTAAGDPSRISAKTRTALVCLLAIPASAWLAALLMSTKSELMITRCLVMLAPLLLLCLAYWLARPREGTMLMLSRGAAAAFFLTYGVTLYDLTLTPSSNARELAAAVAARTKPTDLLVIAPEWLASSFNRYFQPSIDQVDFPNVGRQGTVDFSGVRERIASDSAAAHALGAIMDARRRGRRTWLIIHRKDARDVSAEEIPLLLETRHFGEIGLARVAQIRALLDSTYGQPDTSVVTHTRDPQYEDFRAFLFTPSRVSNDR